MSPMPLEKSSYSMSRRSGPGSPIKDMRQQRSMSRRSGPGSPIKDMRDKEIYSASRVEARQQVVHCGREALSWR
ncbi:MAG: hypothetical protein ABSG76_27365 [Xanthobacteraceae bacterium]